LDLDAANRTLGELDVADDVKGIEHALRELNIARGRAVLIVEPNPDQQARLARLVAVRGHRVIGTTSLEGAVAFMRAFPVDLVLLAEEIAGDAPWRVVADLLTGRPKLRVVIMTPPSTGLELPRESTLEYLPRSFDGDALSALLPG
jgi:ActR/RegA family two-component response regulator